MLMAILDLDTDILCCRFSLGSQLAFLEEEDADQKIANAAIAQHPSTTAEIKALVGDLQVLGRSEFKALLRWSATPR